MRWIKIRPAAQQINLCFLELCNSRAAELLSTSLKDYNHIGKTHAFGICWNAGVLLIILFDKYY